MRITIICFLVSLFSLSGVSQELYKFKKGSKEGFINKSGEVMISAIYDDVDDFSENLAKVKIGSKYGYVNSKGRSGN